MGRHRAAATHERKARLRAPCPVGPQSCSEPTVSIFMFTKQPSTDPVVCAREGGGLGGGSGGGGGRGRSGRGGWGCTARSSSRSCIGRSCKCSRCGAEAPARHCACLGSAQWGKSCSRSRLPLCAAPGWLRTVRTRCAAHSACSGRGKACKKQAWCWAYVRPPFLLPLLTDCAFKSAHRTVIAWRKFTYDF